MSRRRVLLVAASADTRGRLSRGLRDLGYSVFCAADVAAAHEQLLAEPIDLIACELACGLDALQTLISTGPTLFVLGTSRDGQLEEARAALSIGAYDYLAPTVSAFDIALAFDKAATREAQRGDCAASRFLPAPVALAAPPNPPSIPPTSTTAVPPTMIFESPRMKSLLEKVRKLATPRTPVLVTGESGTGKELIARTLHALSPRRDGPLVAVNCGALPENLLESLLFGHRRGAFTDAVRDQRGVFEDAHHGTLFLDEVGELPLKLQVKLLRVLQDQQVQPLGAPADEVVNVDVRLIAATLRNLEADVDAGRFRADLYYRLSVVPLHVPPLRERREDILPLAQYFLRRAAERIGRPVHAFTPAAKAQLQRHPFFGNVRELENTIERAVVLCDGTVLDAADLPLQRPITTATTQTPGDLDDLSIKTATLRLEAAYIQRALVRTRGNRSAAARLLGISHRALLYKLRDFGLDGNDQEQKQKPANVAKKPPLSAGKPRGD